MDKEKQVIAALVVIAVVVIAGGRINLSMENEPFKLFAKSGVVDFRNPRENDVLISLTVNFQVTIKPSNMTGLFVKAWYFLIQDSVREVTIVSNSYYHSALDFPIDEMYYLGSDGEFTITVMLDSYYKEEHRVFNATLDFSCNRF